MSEEIIYLGLAAILLTQLITILSTRSLLDRLYTLALRYRGSERDSVRAPVAGDGGEREDEFGGGIGLDSPLGDVFRRYSLLTDRMADLIFQLTQHGQLSGNASPASERAGNMDKRTETTQALAATMPLRPADELLGGDLYAYAEAETEPVAPAASAGEGERA
ncbi:hypothetical protein [Haliangium ochraceum]|uniref:Uncharacterized protein n=1 Tax=Haliangium ochraceum (strain DSM 14365 / JCM 11303 / SMP-2) TaxID=502025 RepID=D0LWT3_HALO1|nr:hypothetical protein [Haliangium ochraceum]ACY14180.1 hypothetical protein Hoch_1630 [Haliangium ochraceum DSM 14365]